ncbi:hypothetical protein ACE418_00785 [Megasphaera sp. WILCCON 0056]
MMIDTGLFKGDVIYALVRRWLCHHGFSYGCYRFPFVKEVDFYD